MDETNENQNQNLPTRHTSNSLEKFTARTAEERDMVSTAIRQSFDLFNTYGKDPKALTNIMRAFDQVLSPYPTDSIMRAFRDWMKTEKTMPTPADILAILNWDPLPASPETMAFRRRALEQNEPAERYKDLTDEQKQEFEKLMSGIKTFGEPVKTAIDPGELDYSHYERHSPEQKEIMRQRFVESAKRLRGKQPEAAE